MFCFVRKQKGVFIYMKNMVSILYTAGFLYDC